MPAPANKAPDLFPLVLLAGWLLAALAVGPAGDFPLNDDWAYGQSVANLLATGRLQFESWMAMTLVAQVLWGAAFAGVFGFSFTVLRVSTLVLAFLGLWAFYRLAAGLCGRRPPARLATVLLAVNPWFFSLSFTFMTDVPFLAFFLISIWFFRRAVAYRTRPPLIAGAFFGVAATLVRQFGLLAPLLFGVAAFRRRRWVAWLPLLLTLAVLLGYIRWLETSMALPGAYGRPALLLERLQQVRIGEALRDRGGALLIYWGLFLLPLLLWQVPARRRIDRDWARAGALAAFFAVAAFGHLGWAEIPSGNILYDLGLGPRLLKDGYFGPHPGPRLPAAGWATLKIAGLAGAALGLWSLWLRAPGLWRRTWEDRDYVRLGAAAALLLYTGFLLVDYYFWDRYLLFGLPLLMLLFLPSPAEPAAQGGKWAIAWLLLFLTGGFSLAATHDYLAWNRARWQALDGLRRQGIPDNRIDGGFEFNAWRGTGPRRAISRLGKSWWYVGDDDYVVAFGDLPCYERTGSFPYRRFLPPGRDSLALLRRRPPAQVDTLFCDAGRLSGDGQAFLGSRGERFGNGAQRDSLRAHSGRYAALLTPAAPYAFSYTFEPVRPCDRLLVQVWRYAPEGNGLIAFTSPGSDALYEVEAAIVRREPSGWEWVQHEITIPAGYPETAVMVFLWNPGQGDVWFDDLRVVWER